MVHYFLKNTLKGQTKSHSSNEETYSFFVCLFLSLGLTHFFSTDVCLCVNELLGVRSSSSCRSSLPAGRQSQPKHVDPINPSAMQMNAMENEAAVTQLSCFTRYKIGSRQSNRLLRQRSAGFDEKQVRGSDSLRMPSPVTDRALGGTCTVLYHHDRSPFSLATCGEKRRGEKMREARRGEQINGKERRGEERRRCVEREEAVREDRQRRR